MKKTGSNLISFPKPRRAEQVGLTQKGFPARWLGVLLISTVGAAWALNPNTDGPVGRYVENRPQVSEFVFEGEPQVVAQLMGATVGAEEIPAQELRALSSQGASSKRVVISRKSQMQTEVAPRADLLLSVEAAESAYSKDGRYPKSGTVEGEYETNGRRFRLTQGECVYDSSNGLASGNAAEQTQKDGFRVAGYLDSATTGWGPWKKSFQQYSKAGRGGFDMSWLEEAPQTPAWSARMYFPISSAHTGYAFCRADGSSVYETGELLYDGITGTFQLKLHRPDSGLIRTLQADKLEAEMSSTSTGSELVGDAGLMADLGFLKKPKKEDSVVKVSSPARLTMSADGALDGLSLSTFTRHKERLRAADYLKGSDEEGTAALVGRLEVVDKVGQVHNVRVRAGRGPGYDWVVGQLCPLESAKQVEVFESSAYDDAYERRNKKTTIVAGQ